MDRFTRRIDGVPTDCVMYTQEEADEQKIPYVKWREGAPGDWCLTDDGYVGKCLWVRTFKAKGKREAPRTMMKFTFARAYKNGKTVLEWYPRKETRDYSGLKPRNWVEKEALRMRTKRTVQVFAQQILLGKVDYKQLGIVYRPDQKIPEATVRRLLKQEKIKEMVTEEIKALLGQKGVSEASVIDLLQEALDLARQKQDVASFLRTVENFQEMLGMKGQRRITTETAEFSQISTQINGQLAEEEKRARLSRTTEDAAFEEVPALSTPNEEAPSETKA